MQRVNGVEELSLFPDQSNVFELVYCLLRQAKTASSINCQFLLWPAQTASSTFTTAVATVRISLKVKLKN